jgi:hypothetical protein
LKGKYRVKVNRVLTQNDQSQFPNISHCATLQEAQQELQQEVFRNARDKCKTPVLLLLLNSHVVILKYVLVLAIHAPGATAAVWLSASDLSRDGQELC